MNLEEKAENYSKGFWNDRESAKEDFSAGYEQCKTDLIDFLKANQKATVKQVLEHLNGMK